MKTTRSTSTTKKTPVKHNKNRFIERVFHEDRLNPKNSGTPRFTTIVYRFDRQTGKTLYGASLFREEKSNELINTFGSKKALRNALRKTATTRLETKPVILECDTNTVQELHKTLRYAVTKYGVSA